MSIRAICIDDKNRPTEIPADKWVIKDSHYHITRVFVMMQQNKISGVELSEHDISECVPFNCYRLSRFAINANDLEKFEALIKECDEYNQLSDIDIQEYVRGIETKKQNV